MTNNKVSFQVILSFKFCSFANTCFTLFIFPKNFCLLVQRREMHEKTACIPKANCMQEYAPDCTILGPKLKKLPTVGGGTRFCHWTLPWVLWRTFASPLCPTAGQMVLVSSTAGSSTLTPLSLLCHLQMWYHRTRSGLAAMPLTYQSLGMKISWITTHHSSPGKS